MKTIIKIEPEWNNAHCSIADAEEVLPGWAELPEALKSVWEEHGPFVAIVANEGVITNMVATEEILGKNGYDVPVTAGGSRLRRRSWQSSARAATRPS